MQPFRNSPARPQTNFILSNSRITGLPLLPGHDRVNARRRAIAPVPEQPADYPEWR